MKLSREDVVVIRSMEAYRFDDLDETDIEDFMPTAPLYEAYLAYYRTHDPPPLDPRWDDLTKPEVRELSEPLFGKALRRCFCIAPWRKTRARVGGKQVSGYRHVRGPGSIRVPEWHQGMKRGGRPKREDHGNTK